LLASREHCGTTQNADVSLHRREVRLLLIRSKHARRLGELSD
jgi:hypothetical protein